MWCTYVFLLLFLRDGLALKILAICSGAYRSHYTAFSPLFREFAKKGHSVTVLNNFPDNEPLPNMRFIDLQGESSGFAPPLTYFENFYLPRFSGYVINLVVNPAHTKKYCENLLSSRNARAHLEERVKYDVVFVEQFAISDCELLYAATFFDAPIIGITSHVLLPQAYNRLGIPFSTAINTFYYSISGPKRSFLDKIEVALANAYYSTVKKWTLDSIVQDCFRRYLPDVTTLDVEQVARERIKMMFAYQHFSVTGAHVSTSQVLEIGGAHVSKAKPVTRDIEKFLSTAEYGTVYVSFGSNLRSSTMSPQKLQQFLTAFKNIPQKVIWKWEDDSFPAGHDNILIKKWVPQIDLLCHPKVVAFVSHGGMLSVSESAHCGKPILAMPFFADQFANAALVKASGLGSYMYFQDVTADSLTAAVKELTSSKMQRSAQQVSKLWHDRPQAVLDSALYWTEYVARHRETPPPLPTTHYAWYETVPLDVISLIFAVILFFYCVCYLINKLIRFTQNIKLTSKVKGQ